MFCALVKFVWKAKVYLGKPAAAKVGPLAKTSHSHRHGNQ
jgi:hypothetical protein